MSKTVRVEKTVPTYTATIYVGLRVGRSADPNPTFHSFAEVHTICRAFCDEVGLCVTLTPTTFIYKGMSETGAAVGLINYPRFPSPPEQIYDKAMALAELLKKACEQMVVTVVFPDRTVMLADETPRPLPN